MTYSISHHVVELKFRTAPFLASADLNDPLSLSSPFFVRASHGFGGPGFFFFFLPSQAANRSTPAPSSLSLSLSAGFGGGSGCACFSFPPFFFAGGSVAIYVPSVPEQNGEYFWEQSLTNHLVDARKTRSWKCQ